MPRRLALALSLAFTTVVMFALVALGANAGFFSDAKKSATPKAQAVAQKPAPDDSSALVYLAALADRTAQAGARAPRVVTEYVYLYETPVLGAPRGASAGAASQSASTQPKQQSAAPDGTSDGPSSASTPTVARPATQPTQPGGTTAPASTPPPAPTASVPPAQPTVAPPTPQPTSPTAPAACRDEFVARVSASSAIAGGSLVTWSNSIQTRVLDSTPYASALQVGVTAHVHVTTAGGCTVTQIELDN